MKDYGKASIIVPVYNTEQYLDQCVNTLINQTYSNFEMILVDDGSKDECRLRCDYWSKQDERITVIHKVNGGLSSARNAGLQASSGRFICFVDSDDWVDSQMLEKAVLFLEQNDADIVFFPYLRESETKSKPVHFYNESRVFCGEEIKTKLVRKLVGPLGSAVAHPEQMDWCSTAWGKLYRTTCIEKNDNPFVDLSVIGTFEDGLFNIGAFSKAKTVVYLDECLYHYRRISAGQLTGTYKPRFFEQTEKLFTIMENMPEVKAVDPGLEALNNRIALGMSAQAMNISRAKTNYIDKKKFTKYVLNSDRYKNAFRKLDTHEMPMHWRAFYTLCKIRSGAGVLLLAEIMRYMKRKNNG